MKEIQVKFILVPVSARFQLARFELSYIESTVVFRSRMIWLDIRELKGAVSRQSSSCCLILPITRPQSLWNLK